MMVRMNSVIVTKKNYCLQIRYQNYLLDFKIYGPTKYSRKINNHCVDRAIGIWKCQQMILRSHKLKELYHKTNQNQTLNASNALSFYDNLSSYVFTILNPHQLSFGANVYISVHSFYILFNSPESFQAPPPFHKLLIFSEQMRPSQISKSRYE